MAKPDAFSREACGAARPRLVRRKLACTLLCMLVAAAWIGCQAKATLGPQIDSGVAGFATCQTAGECIALVTGCCGTCGPPTLVDVAGVNSEQQDAFRAATCTETDPICPKCAQIREPNLVAFCESDQCTPIDVRQDSISVCSTDDDCRLRYPECCEACDPQPGSVVAIAKRYAGLYAAEVCRRGQECPACDAAYPAGTSAACGEEGHCRVVLAAASN